MSIEQLFIDSTSSVNSVRKNAESQLLSTEINRENTLQILNLIENESAHENARMAAATFLKTSLSKVYNAFDSEFSVGRTDRDHDSLARDSQIQDSGILILQENIMNLVYSTPDNISLVISDVCEMIARDSFHEKWPSFVPDCISGLKQDNPVVTMRVLRTFSPVLKKIRYMYRSDDLYTQINYVIECFAPTLTEVTAKTIEYLSTEGLTVEQEKILYVSVVDALSIYESLNTVEEFPDYFEESLEKWANNFCAILDAKSDSELSEFIEAKRCVVDIVNLLTNRFPEFLKDYCKGFFEKIWEMIGKLPATKVFNSFVASITDYVSNSLRSPECRDIVCRNLKYLFTGFLVQHMAFTEDDLEEFESNEEAFIKMDLEENDKETRRRNCFNLVKRLTSTFPSEVSDLINALQEAYCEEYYKDQSANWNKQILVINFIIASTVENYTFQRGAVKINVSSDTLNSYIEKIIVPELQIENANNYPILTSQCIKFLIIYRNLIPRDWLIDIITKLSDFLTNESIVIRSYSACALEKLLSLRDLDSKELVLTKEAISPLLLDLLKQLNILITESEGLNNYALLSLYRLVCISKEDFMPYAQNFAVAIGTFVDKTISDNSTTAYSIYILFETIGYIIKFLAMTDKGIISGYEEILIPKLNKIFELDRTDITIYVFQIYAVLVLNSSDKKLGPTYETLIKSILEDPSNSDPNMKYLVPGELRLLSAALYKYNNEN